MEAFIVQKSQEIGFAVFRVAAHIRRFEMRRNLERLSYNLLENISYENPEMILHTIAAIRNLIALGKNIYEIEPVNAKVLDRELEYLRNEVMRFAGLNDLGDLEALFTARLAIKHEQEKKKKQPVPPKKSDAVSMTPEEVVIPEEEIDNAAIEYGNQESGNQDDENTAIRQKKIVLMIATAPERRLALKEVVAAFPDLSERTIRYDLKRLTDDGRLTRQGSGGPSNYYMVNTAGAGGV